MMWTSHTKISKRNQRQKYIPHNSIYLKFKNSKANFWCDTHKSRSWIPFRKGSWWAGVLLGCWPTSIPRTGWWLNKYFILR